MTMEHELSACPKKSRKPYTLTKQRESWTNDEHERFIKALQLYNRDWKKIETYVGTKTVVQIRSHAQKYFQKVIKSGATDAIPPPRPKRRAADALLASQASSTLPDTKHIRLTSEASTRAGSVKGDVDSDEGQQNSKQDLAASLRAHELVEATAQLDSARAVVSNQGLQHVYLFLASVFSQAPVNHANMLQQLTDRDRHLVVMLLKVLSEELSTQQQQQQPPQQQPPQQQPAVTAANVSLHQQQQPQQQPPQQQPAVTAASISLHSQQQQQQPSQQQPAGTAANGALQQHPGADQTIAAQQQVQQLLDQAAQQQQQQSTLPGAALAEPQETSAQSPAQQTAADAAAGPEVQQDHQQQLPAFQKGESPEAVAAGVSQAVQQQQQGSAATISAAVDAAAGEKVQLGITDDLSGAAVTQQQQEHIKPQRMVQNGFNTEAAAANHSGSNNDAGGLQELLQQQAGAQHDQANSLVYDLQQQSACGLAMFANSMPAQASAMTAAAAAGVLQEGSRPSGHPAAAAATAVSPLAQG